MPEISPFLFFVSLGTALIIAELAIFNLSVFWFLFIGIGAVVTALVSWFVPDVSWLVAWLAFLLSSTTVSVVLYRPLKKWQNKPGAMPGNDVVGQSVEALEDIEPGNKGKVNWSGASWDALLSSNSRSLSKGQHAEIVKASGIVLEIKHKAD